MEKIKSKKTLNLHKISVKLGVFMSNWKITLPSAIAVAGIFTGTIIAKGESSLYFSAVEYILKLIIKPDNQSNYAGLIMSLLIPTAFAVVIFFNGLSVYGNITVNLIPFVYGMISGLVTYHLFNSYTLKGLGYIVIMFLPYAVLSLFSLILMTAESIDMSQVLLKKLSRSKRISDYSFSNYYKNCLKNYIYIIIAALIKTVLDSLFADLFIF